VAGARALAVTCPGREKTAAVLDHFVKRLDIALLRTDQQGLPYLTFSLSISVAEMVLVGDNVVTVVYLKSADGKIAATPAIATVTALAGPGNSPEFLQLAMPADRRDPGAPASPRPTPGSRRRRPARESRWGARSGRDRGRCPSSRD